jgi:hypothetical protein
MICSPLEGDVASLLESVLVHCDFFLEIFDGIGHTNKFIVPDVAISKLHELRRRAEDLVGGRLAEWANNMTMPARPPMAYFVKMLATYHRQNGTTAEDMHGAWFCLTSVCYVCCAFFHYELRASPSFWQNFRIFRDLVVV